MIGWNDTETMEFTRHVTKTFDVREQDVLHALTDEYHRLMEGKRKTKANMDQTKEETLANCRAWILEPRTNISPENLFRFCTSALYFRAIEPK